MATVARQGSTVGDKTYLAIAGGFLTIVGAFVTAFYAMRRTMIESASAENRAYFEKLSDRLEKVEDDLEAERAELDETKHELLAVRASRDNLESTNRLLREQVEATEAQNRLLTIANADLTETIEQLESQIVVLEDELETERRLKLELTHRLDVLEARVGSFSEIEEC